LTSEGDLLFQPSAARVDNSLLTDFIKFVGARNLCQAGSYAELHEWSVRDVAGFWEAFADWGGVIWRKPPTTTFVAGDGAEGGQFFVGSELNYVDHVLRHPGEAPAVVALDEKGHKTELTYGEITALAGAAARGLTKLGVQKGDRVAAVLPNGVEAIVAFLAAASLGAVWSSCAPEFGAASMTDRFRQIAPKVLIVADGYTYGGKDFSLNAKTRELAAALPGLEAIVQVPVLGGGRDEIEHTSWRELLSQPGPLETAAVGFDHPLWILYSSGTTGLPKPIVQGHGGIVVEHLKAVTLHSDLRAGDRFFWFSTTGWMMWNFLVGGLLGGTTIVCYDGSPVYPDQMALWRMAADEAVTFFGTSAPFIEACRKAGLSPRRQADLSRIHSIGSTGAPLTPEGFAWAATEIGDDVLVGPVSGGTDVCTGFLHACPLLPVYAGELQCAALGCAVEAYSTDGQPVVGAVGELVITEAMPSMPVSFWGDEDGSRLHNAYFAEYPGVWRHGDWVKRTRRGTYVVYGRSDATLNRGGVRMGTAEFYRVVETIPGVDDALVIDTSELGREGELILLVVAADGADFAALDSAIRTTLRREVSPRHVPDKVLAVRALPRTLNGKKVEVPIRRILLGASVERAVATDALADPSALDDLLESLRQAGVLAG
jgi:acetoacetyl-CoA synthetase